MIPVVFSVKIIVEYEDLFVVSILVVVVVVKAEFEVTVNLGLVCREMIPVVFSVEVVGVVEALVFEVSVLVLEDVEMEWIIEDVVVSNEGGVGLIYGLAVLVLVMKVVLLLVDKAMVDVVEVVLVTVAAEALLEGVAVVVDEIVVVEMGLFFKNSCNAKNALSKIVKKV